MASFYSMSHAALVTYNGEKMTKEERDKAKIAAAEDKAKKTIDDIKIINRALIRNRMINETLNETEPICKVTYHEELDGMIIGDSLIYFLKLNM